jgi:hypothetical protein
MAASVQNHALEGCARGKRNRRLVFASKEVHDIYTHVGCQTRKRHWRRDRDQCPYRNEATNASALSCDISTPVDMVSFGIPHVYFGSAVEAPRNAYATIREVLKAFQHRHQTKIFDTVHRH